MSFGFGFALPHWQTLSGGGFSPASLFSSGEQGAWYDPSDINVNWRYNLLTYTEQFNNAVWTQTSVSSISANASVAPDGTTTADLVTASGIGVQVQLFQIGLSISNGVQYTATCYFKAGTSTWAIVNLYDTSAGNKRAWFNLTTGTVGTQEAGVTASIQPAANGFYRCSVTRTVSSVSGGVSVEFSDANGSQAITAGRTMTVWGAQLQTGAVATTYQQIVTPEISYLNYDPDPVLFQDSAGTTPVTAVEQPVGLVLDKSKGLVLGSELVTNGGFDSGTTGWTAGPNNTLTNDAGRGKSVSSIANGAFFGQTFSVTAGVTYKIQWSGISDGTSVVPAALIGTTLGSSDRRTEAQTGGYAFGTNRTFYYLATATETLWLWFYGNSGQPIGNYILIDNVSIKSIAGNHAYQTTSASRPTLRARYNLLTYSEQFDNAAWVKSNMTVTANGSVAPDGTTTADAFVESVDGGATAHTVYFNGNAINGVSYTFSVYAKYVNRPWLMLTGNRDNWQAYFDIQNGVVGNRGSLTIASSIQALADGWYRCSVTVVADSTIGVTFMVYSATSNGTSRTPSYTGTGATAFFIWGAQLVPTAVFPSNTYQRIAAATDYATGSAFPPYLFFDGVDDSLLTNSVDFSAGDKMTVWAGVTKTSTGTGVLSELSADNAVNNGSFLIGVDSSGFEYFFTNRGTANQSANADSALYSSPVTNVLQMSANIAGPSVSSRINGVTITTNTGSQGTGNYGNYPLYIGRRNNASFPFNGTIYSLIIRGAQSTAAQISSTESWVAAKTPLGTI